MGKIKILYIVPSMKNAGPVNMCLSLIKGLNKSIYNVTVLSLGGGVLESDFNGVCKVIRVSKKNILKINSLLKGERYDIIHSHCLIADIAAKIIVNNKAKKITTIHNYPDIDFIYRRGWILGQLCALLYKNVINSFLKVACSISVMKYCSIKLKYRNIDYVSNGVDYNKTLTSGRVSEVRSIYYIGSLNERKDVGYILESFREWSVNKNVQLHIIGDGEMYNDLSNEYGSENIVFYGHVNSASDLLIDKQCYISSSNAEGMPLALLECLSMGKLYICSDIEPHVEVYDSKDKKSGWIFNKDKKKVNITKCLDDFYNLPDSEIELMSALSKEIYEEKYTSEKMVESYEELYLKTLGV